MSVDEQIAVIRDADLLTEVERARGHFMFKTIIEHIAHKQALRDAEHAKRIAVDVRRAAMSRDQRRRTAQAGPCRASPNHQSRGAPSLPPSGAFDPDLPCYEVRQGGRTAGRTPFAMEEPTT